MLILSVKLTDIYFNFKINWYLSCNEHVEAANSVWNQFTRIKSYAPKFLVRGIQRVARRFDFGLQTFRPFSTLGRFGIGRFAQRFGPDSALDKLRLILTMYITFYLILSLFDCWRFCIQGIFVTRRIRTQYTNSLVNSNHWYELSREFAPTYNFYFNKLFTMCKLYRPLFPSFFLFGILLDVCAHIKQNSK